MLDSTPSESFPHADREKALEHLRIIRSLMEKRRVYRALSAPGAVFGGVLSSLAAFVGIFSPAIQGRNLTHVEFLGLWMGVLMFTTLYNYRLLRRESNPAGPRISDNMRWVFCAIFPAMLSGGLGGVLIVRDTPLLGAVIWVVTYGLALHSMWSFGPRSIKRLAWAFLATGWTAIVILMVIGQMETGPQAASVLLGLTFGGLHLSYAFAIMLRPVHEIPGATAS